MNSQHSTVLPKPKWQITAAVTLTSMVVTTLAPVMSEPVHPEWWADGVINGSAKKNKGVANTGQLKNIANKAHAELESKLPNGAEYSKPFEPSLAPDAEWYAAQKKPINLGQLKAAAKPFYERLNEVSPAWVEGQLHTNGFLNQGADYFLDASNFYPWNPATPALDNYKLATVGQLKAVFAMRTRQDSDADGIYDLWEHIIIDADPNDDITGLEHVSASADELYGDFDNDGSGNLDEFLNGTNALVFEDADIDGISDHQEQLIIDYDLDDDVVDFTDVYASSDFDSDGLKDIEEFQYGLNFYDRFDSMKDLDGDRIPTLHEVWKGTDPLNGDSSIEGNVPEYDYIVDQNDTVLDPDDNIYLTIQEAVNKLPPFVSSIVFVKAGHYEERVSSANARYSEILMLADVSGDVTVSSFEPHSYSRASFSIDGFIVKGAYITAYSSGGIDNIPSIISNCIFDGNKKAIFGGRAPLVISHCTFRNAVDSGYANEALYFRAQTSGGVVDYYKISNCSIWSMPNPDKSHYTDEIVNSYTSQYSTSGTGKDKSHVVAESNFIRGGLFGGVDELPDLNGDGFIKANSNLINQGQGDVYVTHDIHGELRVTPDVGADEWVDVDSDGLPDEWENKHFGSLSRTGSDDSDNDGSDALEEYELGDQNMSPLVDNDVDEDGIPSAWDVSDTDAADALIDTDLDGLNLLEEYLAKTDPNLADTDDDGLTDKEELDNGLNPNDWTDALRDFDGDRVPNLWEIKLIGLDVVDGVEVLTLAHTDSDNTPLAHITVDPEATSEPNTYASIAAAMEAKSLIDSDCVIINVKPGEYIYERRFAYLSEFIEKPLLLLADNEVIQGDQINSGYPDLVTVHAEMYFGGSAIAFDGFKFIPLDENDTIVWSYHDLASLSLTNCLFVSERTLRSSRSLLLPSAYTNPVWGINGSAPALISHCSFIDSSSERLISKYAVNKNTGSNHQIIENSLFYTSNGSEPIDDADSSPGIEIRNSIFTNQYFAAQHKAFSIDPTVTALGYLKQASPAIGAADARFITPRDLFGQQRDSLPDIGAVEFIDTDGDGLPDWLESASDLLVGNDEDGDLLNNLEEYEFGSSLWLTDEDGDGLDDYGEHLAGTSPLSSDTDIDGMSDGDEITYGFDPLDWSDALDDADGDNIPNVYELARGTDPLIAESEASLDSITDYYVNSVTGAMSSSDNIYVTLAEAYNELRSDDNNEDDYYIIRLAAGEYPADFYFYLPDRRVLMLGEADTEAETIIKLGGDRVNGSISLYFDDTVLSNLVFEQSEITYKTGIRAITAGADDFNQFKIHNCIFRGFDSDAFYHLLWLRGGHNYIENCTFYGNRSSVKRATVDVSGYADLEVRNSILWNPEWSATEVTNTSGVTYHDSLIGGDDPLLTIDGYLKYNSPAIDAVPDAGVTGGDLHGEPIAGSARDIGADEFIDADGDLVADSWEIRHYGTLGNDADYDFDEGLGDTATSLEEYNYALDPNDTDTDDDNVSGGNYSLDGYEIHRASGETDARNPDTDGDTIYDGYEIKYQLDPLDYQDSILDKDGDRIPNVHEWDAGTSASDGSDFPSDDYIVNPANAGISTNDNIYATVGEVIAKINEAKDAGGSSTYQIVKVHPGLYEEQVDIDGLIGLALIADREGEAGYPEFRINDASENVLTVEDSYHFVLDSFVISRSNVPGFEETGGEGLSIEDRNVYRDFRPTYRITNCLFKEHYRGFGALYLNTNSNATCFIDHCTFINNLSHSTTSAKSIRSNYTTTDIVLRNSILWNLGDTGAEIYRGNYTISNSYIYGDSANSLPGDPLVNQQYGFLRPGSPAIDSAAVLSNSAVSYDYIGELRDVAPDVGIDEFVDLDGDGLSDSWEVIHGFDITVADSNNDGISDGADSNGNGILDGQEDPDGDGLTNLEENGFDEDPNVYNIVESVTPDRRWVDVLDDSDRSMSMTVKLHRTDDQVIVHFRKFSFETKAFDSVAYPGVEDFAGYVIEDTSLASVAVGSLSGDLEQTVTWDGLAGTEYNDADVILPVIEMIDSNGDSHFHTPITSYYVPEVSVSQFPIVGGGSQGSVNKTVWKNYPHIGTLGSDSMIEPVLIHHKLFPNLVNQRPIFGATSTGYWIPFEQDGTPWAETGDYWMGTVGKGIEGDETSNNAELKFFSVRRLPASSVVCLNQSANVESYSVESYESSAAHGEVSHAVFNLDRAADVTLTMLSPGGEEMPLYYRDTNGNYISANGVDCPAGENALEFFAMDYSDETSPKVLDNLFSDESIEGHGHFKLREVNGNPIGTREYRRYWRVKFTITDQRTGHVRTKWALVKVLK